MLGHKFKQCCIPEVFLEISTVVQILSVDVGHRQIELAKMAGKFQERHVLLADVMQNANGTVVLVAKPENLASRGAELPLQRLYLFHRCVEMLLEELF